nr:MAG TPA: hypothetical protein [Caudoviricetes sp.]
MMVLYFDTAEELIEYFKKKSGFEPGPVKIIRYLDGKFDIVYGDIELEFESKTKGSVLFCGDFMVRFELGTPVVV